VLKDSLKEPTVLMPAEMRALVELMRERGSYSGGNQQLADLIAERFGNGSVRPKSRNDGRRKSKGSEWRRKKS